MKQAVAVLSVVLLAGCALESGEDSSLAAPVARAESSLCRNALSTSEQKLALKLIDDICGDTWCEGDNNFAFDSLSCRAAAPGANGGTCTLKLRIIPRTEDPVSYSRTCTTNGFSGFASLVETASNGYQSLNWDYYLALTDCIDRLESALPQ